MVIVNIDSSNPFHLLLIGAFLDRRSWPLFHVRRRHFLVNAHITLECLTASEITEPWWVDRKLASAASRLADRVTGTGWAQPLYLDSLTKKEEETNKAGLLAYKNQCSSRAPDRTPDGVGATDAYLDTRLGKPCIQMHRNVEGGRRSAREALLCLRSWTTKTSEVQLVNLVGSRRPTRSSSRHMIVEAEAEKVVPSTSGSTQFRQPWGQRLVAN